MKVMPLLTADDIEVKVKKVTQKGAIALLYKTARTDMDMLDRVFGAENWQCRYEEIKGNLYCTILMRSESGDWVAKQDCGIESRSDGDGNEKKGEASDAFKRAGFRWGIGRELYTAPFTFLQVPTVSDGNGYKLQNPFARFDVASIGYDDNRRINALTIVDDKGVVVFTYGKRLPEPGKRKESTAPVTSKSMINTAMKTAGITEDEFKVLAVRLRGNGRYVDKLMKDMDHDELSAALDVIVKEAVRLSSSKHKQTTKPHIINSAPTIQLPFTFGHADSMGSEFVLSQGCGENDDDMERE